MTTTDPAPSITSDAELDETVDVPTGSTERRRDAGQPLLGPVAAPLAGLVVAAFALGVAELVAATSDRWRSPVLDVGDRVVDGAPRWLKQFAVDSFGTNDKPVLLAGIAAVLVVFAFAVVGNVGFRKRFPVGVGGVVAFGAIGAWAARGRRGIDGDLGVVVPAVVGAAAGVAAMLLVRRVVLAERRSAASGKAAAGSASDRRRFLTGSTAVLGGLGAAAVLTGGVGRQRAGRFSAAGSRDAVRLPASSRPAASAASSTTAPPTTTTTASAAPASVVDDSIAGISSFITPNRDFYRIDTALSVPQLSTGDFSLRVHGMVDREIELTWDQLLDRDVIEREITICCVSNPVNGPYIGTAKWLGVPLRPLLEEAGVDPAADQVVPRSVDGWAAGFPTTIAMDGRDAMIAVGMNDEPLPLEHGFPARLIVPGLYGYVSATKWLTEIELTTFADFQSYWVPRGWSALGPIKTMSRIDTPRGRRDLAAGRIPIAGVAWDQHIGIDRVEVSIDDGPWQLAALGETPSADTWVQWVFEWDAEPGTHEVRARATNARGDTQTDMVQDVAPDGATGYPSVTVTVGS